MIIVPTIKKNVSILALGAESSGNFSVYDNGSIYFSEDYGDLLDDKKFSNFQKDVLKHIKNNKIKPKIIITDLHPMYKTTVWGASLAKKLHAEHFQVQHHLAHIFSSAEENKNTDSFIGIASDGTGYGLDNKIWGGEVFDVKLEKQKIINIERVGHLENQLLIGGDLAVKEPARMLISILSRFLNKDRVYDFIKEYYNRNQFEALYNQLQQRFNCEESSSTGRILDAVSILLGFCKNKRAYKHEPIDLLERNSTLPYNDLEATILKSSDGYSLSTTELFKYLIKNIDTDKKRLAATAQLYIAKGLYEIASKNKHIYFAGGVANNQIVSSYLESKGAKTNKKIPRGDAGISLGQIAYYFSI